MKAQLKAEWYKLRHSRVFGGIIVAFIILLLFYLFLGGNKMQWMQFGREENIGHVIGFILNTSLPDSIPNASYIMSWRNAMSFFFFIWIIALLFSVLFYTKEYAKQTIRLNVSYGINPGKIYLAKVILIHLTLGIIYFIFISIIFFHSYLKYSYFNLSAQEISYFYMYTICNYLVLVVFVQICLMIATIIKNIGITVLISCMFIFFGFITYPMYFERMDTASWLIKFFIHINPMYYWMSISAYTNLNNIVKESFVYFTVGVLLTVFISCFVLKKQEIK